ncbi:MAG: hypothetical protein OXF56_06640 [Rhodobacteraceae bacterium]|nr:hypothetical protein [Paracoccaceae bacterium]
MADAHDAARAALSAIRRGQPAVASPDETMFMAVAEEVFCRYVRHWKPLTLQVNR